THHAVHDDHVGWLYRGGVGEQVVDAPRGAVGDAARRGQLSGVGPVGRYQLDDLAAGCAALQQLCLDGADAAADLQHPRAGDRDGAAQVLDHPILERTETGFEVVVEVALRGPGIEHLFARTGSATGVHRLVVAASRAAFTAAPSRAALAVRFKAR